MLKVLIIDDDEIVLLVERKMLERCGIASNSISFSAGKPALEYLYSNSISQNFLILLDINMPGMNGWEFLEALEEQQLSENIYVIMVTSSIDRYDKEKARKFKSVIGFIEKPITSENCSKIKSLPEISGFF